MEKTIKTSEILAAYQVLASAKYGKLEDAEKISVFRLTRVLKPVATAFEDASREAAEKLKPENFEERLEKARRYERVRQRQEAEEPPLSEEEYGAFAEELRRYNRLVSEAVEEYSEKAEVLDFEPMGEETLGRLMGSNEWTMREALALEVVLCQVRAERQPDAARH